MLFTKVVSLALCRRVQLSRKPVKINPMENTDDYPILAGQVMTKMHLHHLKQAFDNTGVAARIGESSHYVTGHYVAVENTRGNLTFERIENDEYLVGGDADTVDELLSLATSVSNALSKLQLRHRFEIYFPDNNLVVYLHYDWPQS